MSNKISPPRFFYRKPRDLEQSSECKKNKIDKYVNKPNELDVQMKHTRKTINKQGKYIEELEKKVAMLETESHPPIFAKKDYKDILDTLVN